MTVRQAIALGRQALAAVPDPEVDTLALLGQVTGDTPLNLRLRAAEALNPQQEERYRSLLLLRAGRQPLQYLLGTQCFYGLDFAVDGRVLIPRPETETLCELALETLRGVETPAVADVCTGSGAIAVTLKCLCPAACVTATDVSADALAVAKGNAQRNGAQVRFLQGDLLEPLRGERFHVLACNPPYVDSDACDTLQPEVRFEPRLALDGGPDGLAFYRRLAAEAPDVLLGGGALFLEVGDGQADAVAGLLRAAGRWAAVTVYRDLFGQERVVCALREAFPT